LIEHLYQRYRVERKSNKATDKPANAIHNTKHMAIFIFSLLVLVPDQLSKLAIKSRFDLNESLVVLGNVLHFTYIQNPGMAFGLDFGNKIFLTVFAAIASAAILVYLYRVRQSPFSHRLAFALILGGAIGNLIDRLAYGEVIDFIEIRFSSIRWPFVFNLADVGLTIGMCILIWRLLFVHAEKESTSLEI
jgi:signal peptidase II